MTINEKIHFIRVSSRMSQAELAFKTEKSISDIKHYETNGSKISGFDLINIIKALGLTTEEFQNIFSTDKPNH